MEAEDLRKKGVDANDEQKLKDFLASEISYAGKDMVIEKILKKYQ